MKDIFHTHTSIIEEAHDFLESVLPHHKPTWRDRLRPFLIVIGTVLTIIFFVHLFISGEPESDNSIVTSSQPTVEDSDIVVSEAPIDADVETPIIVSESLTHETDNLITRATARGVSVAEPLQRFDFSTMAGFDGYRSVFTGLSLSQISPLGWLPTVSLLAVDIGAELTGYSRVSDDQFFLNGVNLSQRFFYQKPTFTDRPSQLTSLLAAVRYPLTLESFFSSRPVDYLSEIDAARELLKDKQKQALTGIEESRQIAEHYKGLYQTKKLEKAALGQELEESIDLGQSINVSSDSSNYESSSAELAILESQFKVYQKLEQDFRAVAANIKSRLDYIDDHYTDLALGKCDWKTCR